MARDGEAMRGKAWAVLGVVAVLAVGCGDAASGDVESLARMYKCEGHGWRPGDKVVGYIVKNPRKSVKQKSSAAYTHVLKGDEASLPKPGPWPVVSNCKK